MKRLAATTLIFVSSWASGDVFMLESGGRLEGEIVDVEPSGQRSYVVRLETGGEVTLDARRVKVITKSDERKQYEKSLRQMRDVVEDHLAMSKLCKTLRLTREAEFHLEQVLRLQPDHPRARQLLGYQKTEDGGWATREDLLLATGYVRHSGGWSLPQHLAIEQAEEAVEERQVQWRKDLRMWRTWLGSEKRELRMQALESIRAIRDPAAAPSLAKIFAREKHSATREVLAEVLGSLGHASAAAALTQAAMTHDDREVRLHSIEQLAKGPNRRAAVRTLITRLRSKSNLQVNRAAVALRKLEDRTAVRPLIDALVTRHKFTYQIGGRSGNMNLSFNRDGAGNGGGLGGLAMGNRSKTIMRPYENKSVLNALVALTGENFKYSTADWKSWYVSKTSPPGIDLRRDG